MRRSPRRLIAAVTAFVLAAAGALALAPPAAAASGDLLFSEYIEGSSNNKALEIYNPTTAPVDLAAAGYSVQQYSNGSTTVGLTVPLTGTIAPDDVFVSDARARRTRRSSPRPTRPRPSASSTATTPSPSSRAP